MISLSAYEEVPHPSSVLLEGDPPLLGEAQRGHGLLLHELLIDPDVPMLLQLAHVAAQVPEGQAGLVHQEHKVGALNHVKVSHEKQPSGLMDQLVDCLDPGVVILRVAQGCSLWIGWFRLNFAILYAPAAR